MAAGVPSEDELRSMVVVPRRPGPLRRLDDLDRHPDEVDHLLDEVFGKPDDRGPGMVDALLVAGGLAAVLIAALSDVPSAVGFIGAVAVGIGAVFPLRWLWRRLRGRRQAVNALQRDGVLLQAGHPDTADLLAAYVDLLEHAARLGEESRRQVTDVAHAAVLEVASLLRGVGPHGPAETEYVAARTHVLVHLGQVVSDPQVGDAESVRRQAQVDARREVDELAGTSALADAADLSRRLLEGRG